MKKQYDKGGILPETDWDLIAKLTGADKKALELQAAKITVGRHHEIGLQFQNFAFGLVAHLPNEAIVVETGVRTGVSTYFLLEALALRGGHLFSCDPMYKAENFALGRFREYESFPYWRGKDALFDNWTFFGMKSADALQLIAQEEPEWDVFIHDSDHSAANMRYELDFAWDHVKPGGFIVVDDPTGEPRGTHAAFAEWAEAKRLYWGTIGTAVVVQKPEVKPQLVKGPDGRFRAIAEETQPMTVHHLDDSARFGTTPEGTASVNFLETAEEEAKRLSTMLKERDDTPGEDLAAMEEALKKAMVGMTPAPTDDAKKDGVIIIQAADDKDKESLDDLSDLSKPSKGTGAAFSDADLDELDEE